MENANMFAGGAIRYTIAGKVQVLKWYWGQYSVAETRAKFFEEFLDRPVPSPNTIYSWCRKLETEVCLNDEHVQTQRPARKLREDTKVQVCAAIENQPTASTRALANITYVPRTTVRKVLQEHGYHPYKLHFVQKLIPGDGERWIRFCREMQLLIAEQPDAVETICFTDQATFILNGKRNRQNLRFSSRGNPKIISESNTQWQRKVNVWLGILGPHLIGPFLLTAT